MLQCAPTPPLACAHARLTNPRGASGRPRGQELSRALCDSHAPRVTSRALHARCVTLRFRAARAGPHGAPRGTTAARKEIGTRGASVQTGGTDTRSTLGKLGICKRACALDQPRSASGPFPRRIMGVRGAGTASHTCNRACACTQVT